MIEERTLRDRIKKFFKNRPTIWVNGRDIEELAMNVGYKASNASRRMRELCEEGYLDREERKGRRVRSVWYKYHDYL